MGAKNTAAKPKAPQRNCDKYESAMWAREAFLEEHPFFIESDELHEVIGWLYDRPKRERRRKAPVAAPAGAGA